SFAFVACPPGRSLTLFFIDCSAPGKRNVKNLTFSALKMAEARLRQLSASLFHVYSPGLLKLLCCINILELT
ncbi:hypothetical protein, partial [Salmonella enterica]|uniref:hypothetical protein n=1 Tax=Salmonella enterica TaxID=28901 RepID=UPI001E4999CE